MKGNQIDHVIMDELSDGVLIPQPIDTAPTDGSWVLVLAPAQDGLPPILSVCNYHPDAGWCVDEIREVTHWYPAATPAIAAFISLLSAGR